MEQDGLQFEIGPSRSLFGSSLCQGSDRLWRRRVVNGVNIIKWNDGGQIVEFKVMLRPLRAINVFHQRMAAMLQSTQPAP